LVEYSQCCKELCEIALICVHEEGTASADFTVGTCQLSILCVRTLLERDSTLDVKHFLGGSFNARHDAYFYLTLISSDM